MKTIRCRHREGSLVVKIFVKPAPGTSLGRYLEDLRRGWHPSVAKNK